METNECVSAILATSSNLWKRAERLSESLEAARKELLKSQARLRTLQVEAETIKLSKQEAISPVPLAALIGSNTDMSKKSNAKAAVEAIERAFGIKVAQAGKGKLRVFMDFEPPVPALRVVLDVSGQELKITDCTPHVVGIERLVKDMKDGAAQLAKFLIRLRVAHKKQRA